MHDIFEEFDEFVKEKKYINQREIIRIIVITIFILIQRIWNFRRVIKI